MYKKTIWFLGVSFVGLLALCIGVKNAIFNVLTMFKINVPEKM